MKNRLIPFVIIFISFSLVLLPSLLPIYAATKVSSDFSLGATNSKIDKITYPNKLALKQGPNTYLESNTTDNKFTTGSVDHANLDAPENVVIQRSSAYLYTPSWITGGFNTSLQSYYSESNGYLYYAAGNYYNTTYGFYVIDTKKTIEQADDEIIGHYTTTSTPAISFNGDEPNIYVDETNHLIYAFSNNALETTINVIDTKGTRIQSDDTIFKTYGPISQTRSECRAILNQATDSLYVPTNWGDLTAINRNHTLDTSDDTITIQYAPGNGWPNGGSKRCADLDETAQNLYVAGSGLLVVNTNGTTTDTDDTIIANYTYNSTPAIPRYKSENNNLIKKVFYDTSSKAIFLLYATDDTGIFGEHRSVAVIDTKGTPSQADDTLTNITTSNAHIVSNNIADFTYDKASGKLFLSTWADDYQSGALIGLDTHHSANISDFTESYFEGITEYGWGGNYSTSILNYLQRLNGYSTGLNALYGDAFGPVLISLQDKFFTSGNYTSKVLTIADTPHITVKSAQTKTANQSVGIQTRYATEDGWTDDFDDNSTSEYAGDFYSWGEPFSDAVESNGTLKLSNSQTPYSWGDNRETDFWIDTGKAAGYFPAGSIVTARVRINSNREAAPSWKDYMYNDNWWDDNGGTSSSINNEWQTWTIPNITHPFSKIGFGIVWKNGTWNNLTDSFEIDWIKISKPSWGGWSSECLNQTVCNLPAPTVNDVYLQYKLNMYTTDTSSTPRISSVTLGDLYQTGGEYISEIIDGTKSSNWKSVTLDATTPANTGIATLVRTSSDQSTWSDWATTAPDNRYFQYKLTLNTTDSLNTPIVTSVSISYYNINSSYSSRRSSSSSSSTSSEDNLKEIKIKIIDSSGNPVKEGTAVTLLPDGKTVYTDVLGVATFEDVDTSLPHSLSLILDGGTSVIPFDTETNTTATDDGIYDVTLVEVVSLQSSSSLSSESTSSVSLTTVSANSLSTLLYILMCLTLLVLIAILVIVFRRRKGDVAETTKTV